MFLKILHTFFKKESSYRMHVLSSFLSSMVNLAAFWFIWNAIFSFSETGIIQGFTFEQMITYFCISTAISFSMSSWLQFDMEGDVKTGKISNMLTKPFNYILFRINGDLGRTSLKLLTRTIPIALVSLFVFNISFPASPLFFISSFFALFINIFISVLIGLWSFWSKGGLWGLSKTVRVIARIMSGALIPIVFFPQWLKEFAQLLPFQAIYSIPISIYIGEMTFFEMLFEIGIQVFWFSVLSLMIYVIWKKSERRIIALGG